MKVYDGTKCKCRALEGHFLLAQFYYDTEQYDKAWKWYSKIENADLRGRFSVFIVLNKIFFFVVSSLSTCGNVFRRSSTKKLYTGLIRF